MNTSIDGKRELNPKPILDMNYAFAQTALLIAAIRLHIFTILAQGPLTPAVLAERAHCAAEPIKRLLQGLKALGLVEQTSDIYHLAPLAQQFLVEGSPSYLGGDTLAMMDYIPAWLSLDHTLRTSLPYRDLGDAATAESFFSPRVRDLFPLVYPIASRAAKIMSFSKPVDAPLQILDVGAGSAPWSAAFLQQNPYTQVTAIDLPGVVTQGKLQIEAIGVSQYYTWLNTNMESFSYPEDTYDVIFAGHIYRFMSDERVIALQRKLSRSLRAGGYLLIADIFFPENYDHPTAITLDLSMLVNTAHGRIRTCNELIVWLRESGLFSIEKVDKLGPFPILLARKNEVN